MRAILTYHSLDASGSPISVDPGVFRAQMRWLARHGPRVVPLSELLRRPHTEDVVALTFDDGFQNFWDEGLPALDECGLPATMFIVSDWVGRDNGWDGGQYPGVPTLPLMDWDRVGALAEHGVTIGAHSRTHPMLTRLSSERLHAELAGCAEQIQRYTGLRPDTFAYPFGDCDERVIRATAGLFGSAVTTELKLLPDEPHRHALPRLDMYYWRGPGQLEAWGTPRFRLRLMLRSSLRRLREAVSRG